MRKAAGTLNVLELVETAKRDGWLIGYRAALGDIERLAASRGAEAAIPALIAELRADAAAIERETKGRDHEQPREKAAAERRKAVATLRKQGLSFAEIGRRIGVSKARVGQLLEETGETVQKSSSPRRKLDDRSGVEP